MSGKTGALSALRSAWPLLLAGFLIQFVVVGGGIDTVGIFLNALSVQEGWSHKSLSTGIAVGAVSAGLATPAVGMLVDRFGVRVPMTLGLALIASGFGVVISMSQPWHFVAANLLLGPGFAGCAMLPVTVAVTVRVPGSTALALGIVGVGSSLGAVTLAPAFQTVIDTVGWRGAYVALGCAIVLVPVPLLLFAMPRGRLRRRPVADDPDPPTAAPPPLRLTRELRRPGVVPLCGVLFVPGLVGFGVQVHLVPLLSDLGHATTLAATALGASIGVSAVGKLGGGFVGDRVGALATMRTALAMDLAAVACLLLATGLPGVVLFVVLHGLAGGTLGAVMPVIALGVLGSERFATLYGLLQLASVLTIGLAPIVPGVIFDATGSYDGAILFWVGAMLLAVAFSLWLRKPTPASTPIPSPPPVPAG